MTIESKFKDYYDFISHRFGADPLVVYRRRPLDKSDFECRYAPAFCELQQVSVCIEYVVAGARVFPIFLERKFIPTDLKQGAEARTEFIQITVERYNELVKAENKSKRWYSWSCGLIDERSPLLKPNLGLTEQAIAEVVKTVGAPVFLICKTTSSREHPLIHVASKIPVLSDYGIASLVSPEQMWQNIYATMSNVLRDNPDKAPPVELSNASRIEKAGFDLRSSFRWK